MLDKLDLTQRNDRNLPDVIRIVRMWQTPPNWCSLQNKTSTPTLLAAQIEAQFGGSNTYLFILLYYYYLTSANETHLIIYSNKDQLSCDAD